MRPSRLTPRRQRLAVLVMPAAALGLGLIIVLAVPTAAQDPEATDALMASLLQTEDLPAGFETLGPEEGSQFDIDSGAFSRSGGRRVVSQTWSSETSGVVFDFRMELPSAEAAARYLEEAESTLSEADTTGLELETDETHVGEDARHYQGVTRIADEQAIAFDNYLFRVGPVAAKVFVASVDLPPGEARRLAETAAERMAVFGLPEIGPGTFEEPSPAPSDAIASLAPMPALPAAGRLAALVPDALEVACRPFSSGTAGEVAALSCDDREGLIVYSAFEDAGTLGEAFATVSASMSEEDRAESCAEGPFLGTYPSDGAPLGRVTCWEPPGGGLVLFWTDDANLVLGGILAETDEHDVLDGIWERARLR